MTGTGLSIRHLVFTGLKVKPAELEFASGCNVVWGASNTGKSFVLKAIDFMLGGSTPLPEIDERRGYETIWLGVTIAGVGDLTLSRSTSGGGFTLYEGLHKDQNRIPEGETLSQKHDHKSDKNLSNFLLRSLGFNGRFVAKNSYGDLNSLSFRNLANVLIVDENSIYAERSPVEAGQREDVPLEHSIFRLMLSGSDDSAIVQVKKPKELKASKAVKLEILDELITELDKRLNAEFQNVEEFSKQDLRLTKTLEQIQTEFEAARGSIKALLEQKQILATDIPEANSRLGDIQVHLARFAQLDRIYRSDIERLESLEEVGFLVSLEDKRDCPLCGASPDAQLEVHGIVHATQVRGAALVEVGKISRLRSDLARTIVDLQDERKRLEDELPILRDELAKIENEIATVLPKFNQSRQTLNELLVVRDRIRQGLALYEQKQGLLTKRAEAERLKAVSKEDKPHLNLPGTLAHEFCQVVSHVLTEWEFPGKRHVSFDEKVFDLKIDGKLRTHNGKGVRAITNAAFRVALLIFCREKGLPHPGLVILDTPLLTYRDPIKNTKFGSLTPDEIDLAQTPLRQKFFEHLYSIRDLGQFIIFENVDLPKNILELAKVEVFLGQSDGRVGFFPVSKSG